MTLVKCLVLPLLCHLDIGIIQKRLCYICGSLKGVASIDISVCNPFFIEGLSDLVEVENIFIYRVICDGCCLCRDCRHDKRSDGYWKAVHKSFGTVY